MILTQFDRTIKVVRSDNGGEYFKRELTDFFHSKGIIHQTSCPETPQQNGVAERKNRQLLEVIRSLMIGSSVPTFLWGDALSTAVYVINRTPSSTLFFQRPLDVLANHCMLPPLVKLMPRIFGCVTYVHLSHRHRTKLESRALKCVFVGYGSTQKGYKCYHPDTRRFYTSMDVIFDESKFYYSPTDLTPTCLEDVHHLANHEEVLCFDIKLATLPTSKPSDEDTSTMETPTVIDSCSLDTSTAIDPCSQDSNDHCEKSHQPLDSTLPPSAPVNSSPESLPIPTLQVQPNNSSEICLPSDIAHHALPPRSTRGIPPVKYEPDPKAKVKYPISNYISSHKLSASYASYVCRLSSISIPSTLQEALADSHWTTAMTEEMKALKKNATWDLVTLPTGRKTVGCRWVFAVKHNVDGTIERYKARLVAKGYTQSYGVDYQETFAPVAKLNTVRVLLSLAANKDWPLLQFDVKNAFLHGDLKEDVYMDPPPGISEYEGSTQVCKLRKALYGLKQSPRAWFGRFTQVMKKFGYTQSNSDHTLFIKHKMGKLTALIIYVDDMVVTGDDAEEIHCLQHHLASEFEMKNLGDLKYFLKIEVARSKHGIFISQRKYTLDLLSETGMLGCKPVDNPMEQNHKLFQCSSAGCTDKGRYQRLVGKLIYLSHTRPDIAYAVSVVSQFMHNPRQPHMDAVECILRYLKSSPGKGLLFSKHGHLGVDGYTDADWAGSANDRRSTSGYFTYVGGNLVTWRSKKQSVVSRSSAEAEYRGMAIGVCELLWLKNLMKDLGFSQRTAMNLYCDNKSAIEIAHNPVQHDRTKHVEVDRHFIKEKLEAGIIQFPFVKSEFQLADVLTKAVSNKVFTSCLHKLSMNDIHAPP
jgi:hypothetical protein